MKNIHTQALNRFVQHNEPKLLSLALYTLLTTIMADSPSTSSDFTSAKLRKKRKHKNIKLPSSTSHSLARLRDKIREEEWFIQCSSWCQNVNKDCRSLTVNRLLDLLKSSWDCFSTETPVILCLGLGSPSSSHIARVQLAFLTEACQQLKVVCVYSFTAAQMYSFCLKKQKHEDISIYDPIFTPEDHSLFNELKMKVLMETANKVYLSNLTLTGS